MGLLESKQIMQSCKIMTHTNKLTKYQRDTMWLIGCLLLALG